jgi:hypothetical protein
MGITVRAGLTAAFSLALAPGMDLVGVEGTAIAATAIAVDTVTEADMAIAADMAEDALGMVADGLDTVVLDRDMVERGRADLTADGLRVAARTIAVAADMPAAVGTSAAGAAMQVVADTGKTAIIQQEALK